MSKNALTLAGLLLIASLLGGKEMADGSADFPPVGIFLTLFNPLDGDRVRPYLAVERNGNPMRVATLVALFGRSPEATRTMD
ncbi:MAG: hypothetical protein AAGL24_08490 [Pseudomonadota bacterium]